MTSPLSLSINLRAAEMSFGFVFVFFSCRQISPKTAISLHIQASSYSFPSLCSAAVVFISADAYSSREVSFYTQELVQSADIGI